MAATERIAAALLATIAWIGLAIQFHATLAVQGSVGGTLAALLWYFTVTTNLLVAAVFSVIAASRLRVSAPSLVAATTLYILLVGITYRLLLHGLQELSGGSAVANTLLHFVTPILVPIYWLAFTPKGRLTLTDPLRWALYPIAYLFYALLRGEFTHRYPYPFLNVNELGWSRALLNAVVIAIVFLAASWTFVWFDTVLARRSSYPSRSISSLK